jgi:hypothetical protein
MPAMSADEILAAIDATVNDDDAVVTFKYVSRKFAIDATTAKRILFAHHAKRGGLAVFCVTGWVGAVGDASRTRVVKLARGADELERVRGGMTEVVSAHVYGVAKKVRSLHCSPYDPVGVVNANP